MTTSNPVNFGPFYPSGKSGHSHLREVCDSCADIGNSIRIFPTTVSTLTSFAWTWNPGIPGSKVVDIFPPLFGVRCNAFLQRMNTSREFSQALSRQTFVQLDNPKMPTTVRASMVQDFEQAHLYVIAER
jgi:hypothetical protein